jgi:hypothetical protein
VNYSRQRVADTLRMAGFRKAADEALVDLPDPVDLERLQEWGTPRGITKDFLISAMGGSP